MNVIYINSDKKPINNLNSNVSRIFSTYKYIHTVLKFQAELAANHVQHNPRWCPFKTKKMPSTPFPKECLLFEPISDLCKFSLDNTFKVVFTHLFDVLTAFPVQSS
jgi:hypothetical protein